MVAATRDIETNSHGLIARLAYKLRRLSNLAQFLYVQRVTGFTISGEPEFEPACTPFFLDQLRQAATYLEFGMGGSTVLAAQQGVRLVSVESDAHFLRAVQDKVKALGLFDAEKQTYIAPDIGLTEAWGAPVFQRATPERVKRWSAYPQAPWALMQNLPGPYFILVDGRFRVACALTAAKFLVGRQGCVIVDDYADRDYYHVAERHLELRQRCGRMALFAPRADIDLNALQADIDDYCADWR